MNKIAKCLLLSACVMLGLPWLAVTFVQGSSGMAAVFLLFFAVDPVFAVVNGISAGEDVRKFWWLTVIPAVFFLAGTWMFFAPEETAFYLYAGMYLVLGLGAMLITSYVRKRAK